MNEEPPSKRFKGEESEYVDIDSTPEVDVEDIDIGDTEIEITNSNEKEEVTKSKLQVSEKKIAFIEPFYGFDVPLFN